MTKINKKHKKIIIAIFSLVVILATSLGSMFWYAEINHNKMLAYFDTIEPTYGELNFLEWNDYVTSSGSNFQSIRASDNAKILVFSDTHLGYINHLSSKLGMHEKQDKKIFDNIKKTVEKELPNLLIFLGDIIESCDSGNEFIKFCDNIDALGVPWTIVFGNHEGDASLYGDTKGFYMRADKAKMANIMADYPNCIFREGYSVKYEDGLYSVGNDIIDIFINDKLTQRVVTMDSNSYEYTEDYDYDHLHDEQIQWYSWATKNNIPNMVFMHMPIKEYELAFPKLKIKVNSDKNLFDEMKANGCTDIFSGHYHGLSNDTTYDDIDFHFAVTSSKKRLSINKKEGYKAITIDADGKVNTQNKKY